MMGVRGYGESEVVYSMIKVFALVGFMFLGIIINAGGGPNGHYYGAGTWYNPGAFNSEFFGLFALFDILPHNHRF